MHLSTPCCVKFQPQGRQGLVLVFQGLKFYTNLEDSGSRRDLAYIDIKSIHVNRWILPRGFDTARLPRSYVSDTCHDSTLFLGHTSPTFPLKAIIGILSIFDLGGLSGGVSHGTPTS